MNQFFATAVAEKIAALRTAAFFEEKRAGADIEGALRVLRRVGGAPPDEDDRL